MAKSLRYAIAILGALPTFVVAAEPVSLSADTYKADLGVLIIQVNWGRAWKCGQFENAQLQALTFTKSPIDTAPSLSIDLETPSKLFVDNKFLPYAFVVQPGEYLLTAFDVKVARSVSDVAHIKGSKDTLLKNGKPIGGTFTVSPGEIVYVGHFGLDCGAEPFLWRSYIQNRADFERYIVVFTTEVPLCEGSSGSVQAFLYGASWPSVFSYRPHRTMRPARSFNMDAPQVAPRARIEHVTNAPACCTVQRRAS